LSSSTQDVLVHSSVLGDEKAADVQVLVVYGSTRGGTAGLAHLVADSLGRRGVDTEVRGAADVRTLAGVDAVVVGGALYRNRWHPDAVAFVTRHRAALRSLPVWFFSSGPLDFSARSGALAAVPQVTALARDVDVRGHMTFGGLLNERPTGLRSIFGWGPAGDFRDPRHVCEWVERIVADLDHDRVPAGAPAPRAAPAPAPTPLADAPAEEPSREAGKEPRGSKPPGRLRRLLTLGDEETDEDDGIDLFSPDSGG
jgi:menaquinone-dependent protoporphyrinogen oxidase